MEKETLQGRITALLDAEGIFAVSAVPYDSCRVLRPYLAERLGCTPQTVILFLVPYYVGPAENVSAYATARDYHLFMKELFERILPPLRAESGYAFFGFADHSPINERQAAAEAGLGLLGENGLLIHEDYGSYVFIGEILTDAPPSLCGSHPPISPRRCDGCSACASACPTGLLRGESSVCLSSVTQKKGPLSGEETVLLRENGMAWGCDACQSVCPYNRRAIDEGRAVTPIAFFREERMPTVTAEVIAAMPDEEFQKRAFSFRGREPLLRNLAILEENEGLSAPLHT